MKNILKKNQFTLLFLIIFFLPVLFSRNYLTILNMQNLFRQASILGILSIGQTLVIITGGIDLSQGSLVALSSVLVATFMKMNGGILFSTLATIFIGIIIGMINGILISKTKIYPFIVTLGMMLICRGVALTVAGGKVSYGVLESYYILGRGVILGIPIPMVILICNLLIINFILSSTRTGRYIYAIGGNRKAAIISGINVEKIETLVYVLSSFFSFVGGMIFASKLTAGYCEGAVGYEFTAIAAALIGGVSLFGGTGKLINVFMGVIVLTIISNFMNLIGVSPYLQGAVKGAIIIITVYYSSKTKGKLL